MTIYVLHHADSDGRFGAYCAWRSFRERHQNVLNNALFIEVQYGQPFPINTELLHFGDQIFIIDFSYDRETLDSVYEKVGFLKVLDHHEDAEEKLRGAPYMHFDKTKSGALLAWEYFFPNQPAPLACLLANDFDLWQWKYKDTAAFETWVRFARLGQQWEKWHEVVTCTATLHHAIQQGALLNQYNESIMEAFANNPENVSVGVFYPEDWKEPTKFAVFNGMGILHSQLSEVVYKKFEVDLSISYRIRNDIVTFSVRSPNPEKVGANTFANRFGGGGRPATAGFRLPLAKGLELINKLTLGG